VEGVKMDKPLPVAHPVFKVVMNGQEVTAVLTPFLLSVSYTDFVEGEADVLDIRVEDSDGRFRGAWCPAKGQTLELEFGYEGEPLQKAGLFEIDEIELEGPPDVVVIRAIAAGVEDHQKTPENKAYDNTTLAAIAQQVARRRKLKLIGKIEPIKITRVTQIYESDLTFMHRVADEYGYAFSVKGKEMIFIKRAELRSSKPILTLDRTDLTRYHIRDKIMAIAESSETSYHNPKSKRLHRYKVQDTSRATSEYEVKSNARAESEAQAKAKAKAALEKANEDATQLELTVFGNPKLVAGINFELTGMGRFGGVYHVVKSRHDIERSGGYRTEIEAKRIPQEAG
jgi:hypothetical protein